MDGFSVGVTRCGLIPGVDRIAESSLLIARRSEMTGQLTCCERVLWSKCLKRLRHTLVKSTAPMTWQFVIKRLLNESVGKAVPLGLRMRLLLQDVCGRCGFQVIHQI